MTFNFDKDDYYVVSGCSTLIYKYEAEIFANGKTNRVTGNTLRQIHKEAKKAREIMYIEDMRFNFE